MLLLVMMALWAPAEAPAAAVGVDFVAPGGLAAVEEPGSARKVRTLQEGARYRVLKVGGPDGAWCKVEIAPRAGWVLCALSVRAGTEGDAQAPAPRQQSAAPAVTSSPPARGGAAPEDGAATGTRAARPPVEPLPGGGPVPVGTGFAYYVLSLSWSPTFCQQNAARAPDQCGVGRRYGFVVHGLWPQHERGFPEHCSSPHGDRLDDHLVSAMLDLMPGRGLIRHEWEKHGTCSGLSPDQYLSAVRRARATLQIPAAMQQPTRPLTLTAAQLRERFREVNPGLRDRQMAVVCRRTLEEVRICMDAQLRLRDCGADVKDRCRGSTLLPPVR